MKPAQIVSTSLLALACMSPTVAAADRGIAELSLDGQSVRALIAAGLPEPLRLEPPGLGPWTLRLDAPERVDFVEGGIEAVLRLSVIEPGLHFDLRVRLVPGIDPLTGAFHFEARSVTSRPSLPVEVDLAGWLGPLELPRRLTWDLELPGGRKLPVTAFLQGLEVLDERLRLELGLSAPRRGN